MAQLNWIPNQGSFINALQAGAGAGFQSAALQAQAAARQQAMEQARRDQEFQVWRTQEMLRQQAEQNAIENQLRGRQIEAQAAQRMQDLAAEQARQDAMKAHWDAVAANRTTKPTVVPYGAAVLNPETGEYQVPSPRNITPEKKPTVSVETDLGGGVKSQEKMLIPDFQKLKSGLQAEAAWEKENKDANKSLSALTLLKANGETYVKPSQTDYYVSGNRWTGLPIDEQIAKVRSMITPKPTAGMPPVNPSSGTIPSDVQPLPASKENLIRGRKYNTNRGVAIWDGTVFQPVQ